MGSYLKEDNYQIRPYQFNDDLRSSKLKNKPSIVMSYLVSLYTELRLRLRFLYQNFL